jgi:ubiquinone biosynthesis protein COQ9
MTARERTLILEHMLKLVPFDGWTNYAFNEASKRVGFDEVAAKRAFPGGPAECMDYFFAKQDEALEQAFPEPALAHMRTPQRIETLLNQRFKNLLPYRESVRRAVAKNTLPWRSADVAASLYRTVDLLWRLAGDGATDFSFYTKRMTLAAIYSSTLLYWLNDMSEQQADTTQFIQRRLQNVASFGKWKKDSKASLHKLFS